MKHEVKKQETCISRKSVSCLFYKGINFKIVIKLIFYCLFKQFFLRSVIVYLLMNNK